MINSFERLRSVNFVDEVYLSELKDNLHQQGYFIYEINGKEIIDAQSFFLEIKTKLPQDPALSGKVHWDAFIDSVWAGLEELGKNKVAFIWTHAENMLKQGLPDLILAVECLKNLSSDLSDAKTGIPNPTHLITFLVGKGDNFKPLTL